MQHPTEPLERVVRVRDVMTENALTIDASAEIRLAVQMMLWGGFRHLPVLDEDGRLVGIVTEHDINRMQSEAVDGATPVRHVMTADVQIATPDDPLTSVSRRMAESRVGCMPVVEGSSTIGIVTSTDVLAHVGRVHRPEGFHGSTVADVMSGQPQCVRTDQSLVDALAEMVSGDFRHLPVVDASGRLAGMLSDRDIRSIVGDPVQVLREEALGETMRLTVDELMTTDPISARGDEPLESLAWALLDERVGAVPVVDTDDRVVGIVSYVDVLHHALRRAR